MKQPAQWLRLNNIASPSIDPCCEGRDAFILASVFQERKGGEIMDPNVPNSDHSPSRSTVLDLALQIGLVGFLVYACSRYISPFSDLLIWSAILAVMLYPLHLRLAVRLGNRWSALLIGLVGVAVMLVATSTQASVSFWPTSGSSASHVGGGGTVRL